MDIEKVIRENIAKTYHLSLGTSQNNQPWVSEVHFAYDDDLNLYFRSLTSRRHSQEIAANPNVAGNIVRQHTLDEIPLGIYFEGTAEKLNMGPEQQKAFECIKDRLQASDNILEEAQRPDGHQFYKITVNKFYIFGKLEESKGGQKYELQWSDGSR